MVLANLAVLEALAGSLAVTLAVLWELAALVVLAMLAALADS